MAVGWIQSFGSSDQWIERGERLPEMRSLESNFCAHFEALKGGRDPITLSGMDGMIFGWPISRERRGRTVGTEVEARMSSRVICARKSVIRIQSQP